MSKLFVKNWEEFQHYKDRNPPWIKLSTGTFQNYEFSRLHDASKLLALCIWTLASRSKDGSVPADFDYIKRQGNLGDMVQMTNLKELIEQGFIVDVNDLLAGCKQSAIPETEGETETEIENKQTKARVRDSNIKLEDLADTDIAGWLMQQQVSGNEITVDVRAELEKFKAHYLSYNGKDKHGNAIENWVAKFGSWLLNSNKTAKYGGNQDAKTIGNNRRGEVQTAAGSKRERSEQATAAIIAKRNAEWKIRQQETDVTPANRGLLGVSKPT